MRTPAAFLALSLLVSACRSDPVCAPIVPGVTVVSSRVDGSPARLELELLWRAGGMREGQELAWPITLGVSADGRLAIPDFQLQEVIVVGPGGEWLGPWTRPGPGPGETVLPIAAAWEEDGTLVAFDIEQSSLVRARDGVPLEEERPVARALTAPIVMAGELMGILLQPDGGIVLRPALSTGGRYSVLHAPPRASEFDTLVARTVPFVAMPNGTIMPHIGAVQPVVAVAPDGSIATAGERAGYVVVIRDPTGAPVRQVCRAVEPLPVEDVEWNAAADGMPEDMRRAILDAPRADTLASIGGLLLGSDGALWVQRARIRRGTTDVMRGRAGGEWDVFDAAGRHVGTVRPPDGVHLLGIRGGTVYGFEAGTLDETEVVAWRIREAG